HGGSLLDLRTMGPARAGSPEAPSKNCSRSWSRLSAILEPFHSLSMVGAHVFQQVADNELRSDGEGFTDQLRFLEVFLQRVRGCVIVQVRHIFVFLPENRPL